MTRPHQVPTEFAYLMALPVRKCRILLQRRRSLYTGKEYKGFISSLSSPTIWTSCQVDLKEQGVVAGFNEASERQKVIILVTLHVIIRSLALN